jgi:hypothetical protein
VRSAALILSLAAGLFLALAGAARGQNGTSSAFPGPTAIPAGSPVETPHALVPFIPQSPAREGELLAAPRGWDWQVLPEGLVYPGYLAGQKESRMASVFNHDSHLGWIWDITLGGRAALLRYGTAGPYRPEGWELGIEGAAFPRLDLEHDRDLMSADFRVGIPLTFASGRWQFKVAGYHLSSHLGDEFMIRFPDYPRINYSRDALILGTGYYLTENLRLYGEAEWAYYDDGGSQPWAFQFGVDYSPLRVMGHWGGAPFFALNGQVRQELDYEGSFTAQAGWQWRGPTNRLLRVGAQYFVGKSDQYEVFQTHEEKIGLGLWYDF